MRRRMRSTPGTLTTKLARSLRALPGVSRCAQLCVTLLRQLERHRYCGASTCMPKARPSVASWRNQLCNRSADQRSKHASPTQPVQPALQMALVHIGVPQRLHAELACKDRLASITRLELRLKDHIDSHIGVSSACKARSKDTKGGSAGVSPRAACLHSATAELPSCVAGTARPLGSNKAHSSARAQHSGVQHAAVAHPTQSILLATPPSQRPDAVDFAALHAMRLSPNALAPAAAALNATRATSAQANAGAPRFQLPQAARDVSGSGARTTVPTPLGGVSISPLEISVHHASPPQAGRYQWQHGSAPRAVSPGRPHQLTSEAPTSLRATGSDRRSSSSEAPPRPQPTCRADATEPAGAGSARIVVPFGYDGGALQSCSSAALARTSASGQQMQRDPGCAGRELGCAAGPEVAQGLGMGPWRLRSPQASAGGGGDLVDLSQSPQATAGILEEGGAPLGGARRQEGAKPACDSVQQRGVNVGNATRAKRRGSGWQKRRQPRSLQVRLGLTPLSHHEC